MVDFKTRIGLSLGMALLTSMLIYALLNPLVVWYLDIVPGMMSCATTTNEMCPIVVPFVGYGIPIIALFLCVASVFEVFIK